MFRRFHHGHSMLLGFLIGLAAMSYRAMLLLALAYVAGILSALVVPPFVRASRHFASVAGDVAANMRARRGRPTKIVDPAQLAVVAATASPPAPFDWQGDLPPGF